jgi:hypothetical protein
MIKPIVNLDTNNYKFSFKSNEEIKMGENACIIKSK